MDKLHDKCRCIYFTSDIEDLVKKAKGDDSFSRYVIKAARRAALEDMEKQNVSAEGTVSI